MKHVIFDVGFPLTMFRLAYYLATPLLTATVYFTTETLADQWLSLYHF